MAMLLAVVMALGMTSGVLAQVAPPWRHQVRPLPTTEITVGGAPLTVELATDPASQARGLGYRDSLTPGSGMLFVFDGPRTRSFWMKGMRFCLDIVWIENGMIQGAAESVCPQPADTADADIPAYLSPVPVTYVLEVPAGWLAANGFGVGTPVEGLPPAVQPAG
jgi:uncharacterized membrane protein (UPF0127 family)